MPASPTTADVAAVIPQRTGDPAGVVSDDFGAATVPTAGQVTNIIAKLAAEVNGEVGAVPAALDELWRWTVTLGAAAQIERSFWPDEQEGDVLWDRYRENLKRLRAAVAAGTTSAAGEVLPVFGYPELASMPFTTTKTRF